MRLTRRSLLACAAGAAAGCRTPQPEPKPQQSPRRPRILVQAEETRGGMDEIVRRLGWMRLLAVHVPEAVAISGAEASPDFILYGGGAPVAAQEPPAIPYGLAGLVLAGPAGPALRKLIAGAAFVFARDTVSLASLKRAGLTGPPLAFAPDAGFSLKAAAEPAAKEFLARSGLEPKKFLAVVPAPPEGGPRSRTTPNCGRL